MSVKDLGKKLLRKAGVNVERVDPLAELIPQAYRHQMSRFLPTVHRHTLGRIIYFEKMVARINALEGDIVECGVSIGHGTLYLMLLSELGGKARHVYGFDSFEGFPPPTQADLKADGFYEVERGTLASPLEMVTKVLQDGRVSPELITTRLHLIRGFFEKSLPSYRGRIALLHLDCDLFESYTTCLTLLYDKVVPGGLIMFDEYEDSNYPGAKTAIDQFFAATPERVEEYFEYGYRKYYVQKAG